MRLLTDRKWILEISIIAFSYTLFILNDWILIKTLRSFFLGISYYLILYTHAQINRQFILPLLFKKNNTYLYIFFTTVVLLAFAFLLMYLAEMYLYQNCFLYNNPVKSTFYYQLGVLLGSYICITGPIMFLEHYYKQKREAKKEIMSNKVTIDLLNKQLNPHFLFNTLNTIYGLSIEFPERTPDTIMKVSELLRYQVENGTKEVVYLGDELDFIDSYIAIEKERLGHRSRIEYNVSIDQEYKYQIAPMIVFTFIENAFKHGTGNINNNFIKIELTVIKYCLQLIIENSISKKQNGIISTKVGLENTRTRLEMIYPEKYTLDLSQNEDQFNTFLQIQL